MIVTTLPITIRKESQFSTLLSPFIANLLSDFLKAKAVISVNCTGRLYINQTTNEIQSSIDWYQDQLKKLGINDFELWKDNNPAYLEYVGEKIKLLQRMGLITEKKCQVLRCKCGAVEISEDLVPRLSNGKLFTINEKLVKCRLCKSLAKPEKIQSLVLNLPKFDYKRLSIFPKWTENELHETARKFSGVNARISRVRPNNLQFTTSSNVYYLDTDFVWSFYLDFLLEKFKQNSVVIVTSNRTIRQAIEVVRFAETINRKSSFSILVNPTIQLQNTLQTKESWNVETFLTFSSDISLRYFLALSLSWKNKSVYLASNQLYWINHSIDPYIINVDSTNQDEITTPDLKTFISMCNANNTRSLLAKLRKKRTLDRFELKLYNLLNQKI